MRGGSYFLTFGILGGRCGGCKTVGAGVGGTEIRAIHPGKQRPFKVLPLADWLSAWERMRKLPFSASSLFSLFSRERFAPSKKPSSGKDAGWIPWDLFLVLSYSTGLRGGTVSIRQDARI